MNVAWHELSEGINDSDNRFIEISVFHSGGAP